MSPATHGQTRGKARDLIPAIVCQARQDRLSTRQKQAQRRHTPTTKLHTNGTYGCLATNPVKMSVYEWSITGKLMGKKPAATLGHTSIVKMPYRSSLLYP